MKKPSGLILLILFCSITFLYHGCGNETYESLYWIEVQGQFSTNDLARAQAEIPFTILLPTYIPDERQDAPLPQISGPLRGSGDDNEIEVTIGYAVDLGSDTLGHILIRERNSHISPGDPELNPDLELIKIDGVSVIKTRDDWAAGSEVYFYFNFDNIYFIVVTFGLPAEEALKVVESMIEQF